MGKCGTEGEVCATYWALQDANTALIKANNIISELDEYLRLATIAEDRGHTRALRAQLEYAVATINDYNDKGS